MLSVRSVSLSKEKKTNEIEYSTKRESFSCVIGMF